METSKEEKVEHTIEAIPLVVGAGMVEAARVKLKCLGVFMGVFNDSRRCYRRFLEAVSE